MDNESSLEGEALSSRIFWVGAFLALIALTLSFKTVSLMVDKNNRERSNLVIMNRQPYSLQKLNSHAEYLRKLTSDIEDVPLSKLTEAVDETARLIGIVNLEIEAQYDAWIKVKDSINSDSKNFDQLRKQIAEAQSFNENEVRRLQSVIERTQENSIASWLVDQSTAFFLGIISSILSTAMYKSLTNKIRKLKEIYFQTRKSKG